MSFNKSEIIKNNQQDAKDTGSPEVQVALLSGRITHLTEHLRDHRKDFHSRRGLITLTNRRVWEHDAHFKRYLKKIRAMAVDMETATVFTTAFANEIAAGALLLVSDEPMTPEGVKTADSDGKVDKDYVNTHLRIGIDSLKQLINNGLTVKHLKF